MRAMVVPRWGEVSALREVAEPEAGPGEAVMKVRSAGVGLTLLNMRSGRFGGSTPRIMGHELSGDIVVESTAPAATWRTGWRAPRPHDTRRRGATIARHATHWPTETQKVIYPPRLSAPRTCVLPSQHESQTACTLHNPSVV